jgi:adenine-specific DNA-methyltransferase
MRFIGNKTKLVDYIYNALSQSDFLKATPSSQVKFYDFFAGTGSVARYFKAKDFFVEASDILYFSYVLQKAFIEHTGEPNFSKLLKKIGNSKSKLTLFASPYEEVLDYLNSLEGIKGFVYSNYTEEGTKESKSQNIRMFFIGDNGKKIDHIRQTIEEWKDNELINEHEYFVLLATIVESVPFFANISGVYAAFLKSYDPRSIKQFYLKPMHFNGKGTNGIAYFGDSMQRLTDINTDILYLDPPYNARQYAPNYHLLETIAHYDNPIIKGVAGIRDYTNQKSEFCNAKTAILALDQVAKTAKYKVLALSYNSEGIMDTVDVMATLEKYGKTTLHELDYRRFKSNSNGDSKHKTHIQEQLFVLER